MAKIFNDLAYGQFVPTYAGMPLEAAEKTAEVLDTRFRENKDVQDQLEIMIDNLNVRDQNRPHVQAALERAKGQLAEIKQNGDWENAGFKVKAAAKEFAMDKGVQGALQDKAQYDAYSKDLDERMKTEKIDGVTYQNAKAYAAKMNQKQVEYDPVTGSYKNIFSGYIPQNSPDIQKAMFEMGEKWKASEAPLNIEYVNKAGVKTNSEVKYDPQLKGYKIVGTNEVMSESELQSGLRQAVLANPKYAGYLRESLMFEKGLKFGNPDGGSIITIEDIFSNDPAKGALITMSEADARKAITELGYDYDEVANDPAMVEGLYNQISLNKSIDGYVNPAASAYSYSKEKHNYLTDHVLLQSMKDANDIRLQNMRDNAAMARQRDAQSFQLKTTVPVTTMNQSAVTPSNGFSSKVMADALTDTKSRLAKAKAELEKNKASNGTDGGDAAEITKRIADLEFQAKTQENTLNGYKKAYLESPEGQSYFDKHYSNFKKAHPTSNISREAFEKKVLAGNNDMSGRTYKAGTTNSPLGIKGGRSSFPTTTDTPESAANFYMNNLNADLTSNIDTYVKNNTPASWTGQVLESSDPKSIVNRQNTTLTNQVMANRTNYKTGGGLQLQELIDSATTSAGDDGISVRVTMSSADQNGQFPHHITIVNKKTGQTISEDHIFSPSNGVAERRAVGIGLMREYSHDPNSAFYKQGNYMAASAEYPAWKNDDILGQLSTVTDRDEAGASVTSETFQAGVSANGVPLLVKAQKNREKYTDKDGVVLGTNTVMRLIIVDPDTPTDPNAPGYIDYNNLKATDTIRTLYQPDGSTDVFKSMDDMKVALYNLQNPNPIAANTQVTGYSQSSSSSTPVK